ncbi:MAG: hypothetical protein WC828_08825 [Thermoleophilia bacterium]|jgi:hypothetical protein
MKKLILFIVVAMAISLIGASVVFAQDSTQATPGTATTDTICPNGGNGPNGGTGNLEQMQQRHEAMSQNVPAEMQERHAAMGEALASGDTERIQELRNEMRGSGTCQKQRNAQQ